MSYAKLHPVESTWRDGTLWFKLNFKVSPFYQLLESDWPFTNFDAMVSDCDQTYVLKSLIEERHLKIKDLVVYDNNLQEEE